MYPSKFKYKHGVQPVSLTPLLELSLHTVLSFVIVGVLAVFGVRVWDDYGLQRTRIERQVAQNIALLESDVCANLAMRVETGMMLECEAAEDFAGVNVHRTALLRSIDVQGRVMVNSVDVCGERCRHTMFNAITNLTSSFSILLVGIVMVAAVVALSMGRAWSVSRMVRREYESRMDLPVIKND
jgi:hypothetical protein